VQSLAGLAGLRADEAAGGTGVLFAAPAVCLRRSQRDGGRLTALYSGYDRQPNGKRERGSVKGTPPSCMPGLPAVLLQRADLPRTRALSLPAGLFSRKPRFP